TASRTWSPPWASASGLLSSGSGPTGPTGTMAYKLYGPNNLTCSGSPVFTSVRTVAWYINSASESYNPVPAGTYQWVINYSGDANNNAQSTTCSDTSLGFTMAVANTTAVSGTPTTVARGGTITVNWSANV